MKTKYIDHWFAWLTVITVWAVFFMLASLFFLFFYPRTVIEADMQTVQDTYSKSDTIEMVAMIQTFHYADSEYEMVINCEDALYNVRAWEANTQPSNKEYYIEYIQIPEDLTPANNCRVVVDGVHIVHPAPLIYRHYYSLFASNSFDIIK